MEEEIGGRDDQRVWFTFPRASYSARWAVAVRRSVVRSENAPWGRGGTSFEDYTATDRCQWERKLTEED